MDQFDTFVLRLGEAIKKVIDEQSGLDWTVVGDRDILDVQYEYQYGDFRRRGQSLDVTRVWKYEMAEAIQADVWLILGAYRMENMTKLLNIYNCARCGDNHKLLRFEQFKLNNIIDTDKTEWDYWSMCPRFNEPILMKVISKEKGNELM